MSARIYGTVKNATTNTLIATAVVTAPPYTVVNSSGSYQFTTPGAATVNVTASAPGFTPQTKSVTVADGQVKRVDFLLSPV
ncbi:MAG: hypothetical protein RLZZ127_145 [Planctomycetota bacterium]|jgi:hypothetical protein